MRTYFLHLFLFFNLTVFSQIKISGYIKDPSGIPLPGANIFIKGSYDGAITDTSGIFNIITESKDSVWLIATFIGYQSYEKLLTGKQKQYELEIILNEELKDLDEVVISAGAFSASEKSRAVLLRPVEIATTASSDGDVYGALRTFPGVQKQGESGMLIVRGGESYESKTYIDDLLVSSPYVSTMPDIPSRGRFSPFIFNGVMFSTGGYSAEYGQALSSVLELDTPGLFDEDVTSISLLNVGVGLSHTKVNKKSSFSIEAGYNNLFAYFMLARHNLDWIKIPESYNLNFYHRKVVGKTGLIKTNISLSHSYSKLNYTNDGQNFDKIGMRTTNILFKTSYNTKLSEKWMLKTGLAYNSNLDNKDINEDKLEENLGSVHARLGFKYYMNKKITLKTGAEMYNQRYNFSYRDESQGLQYKTGADDIILSDFAEGDIKLNNLFSIRAGFRSEYSTYTLNFNAAPRVSAAFNPNKHNQFSLAYGMFYQQPNHEYLQYTDKLEFEKAVHFLANYQVQFGNRFFRIEVFNKQYNNLITYQTGTDNTKYESLGNNGFGYARGIDLFLKDNESVPNLDYWLSYSYIDSKRKYKDYPDKAVPPYLTTHNASIVVKYWIDKLHTQACLTYNYSSGRPYNNLNENEFMEGRTSSIHDLSGNISYITNIFGYYTVLHISVSNIPGVDNIYSYRYSGTPDEFGVYEATPVKSPIQRTFIIAILISIK